MIPRFALALGLALLVSCGGREKETGPDDSGPTIAVVNYPLAYFAERLAGDFATILFETPADEDPAFWKPTDEQIARIQQADLILLNGATYAKWTATATLPFESTVDTSASFSNALIVAEGAVTHTHSKSDAAHSHAGTAFTTWLDLQQASAQANAAAEAIMENWPAKMESVQNKLLALQKDLGQLDDEMRLATAKMKGAPVLASHPVYQYWARAYGLKLFALLWEPEMELDAQAMADLDKLLKANPGAKYFVWEGVPLPGHTEKLKSVGLTSVVISPCGNRPANGDFLAAMNSNLAALRALAPD